MLLAFPGRQTNRRTRLSGESLRENIALASFVWDTWCILWQLTNPGLCHQTENMNMHLSTLTNGPPVYVPAQNFTWLWDVSLASNSLHVEANYTTQEGHIGHLPEMTVKAKGIEDSNPRSKKMLIFDYRFKSWPVFCWPGKLITFWQDAVFERNWCDVTKRFSCF